MIINLFKKEILILFFLVTIHEGAYLNCEVDSKFKTDLHVRTELDLQCKMKGDDIILSSGPMSYKPETTYSEASCAH